MENRELAKIIAEYFPEAKSCVKGSAGFWSQGAPGFQASSKLVGHNTCKAVVWTTTEMRNIAISDYSLILVVLGGWKPPRQESSPLHFLCEWFSRTGNQPSKMRKVAAKTFLILTFLGLENSQNKNRNPQYFLC